MSPLAAEKLGLLLGLSFYFGLSFEGFYWNSAGSRPGGIRTFPLLSLCGALLYALEPQYAVAFGMGFIVLGVWLYPYYQWEVSRASPANEQADGIMVPLCNLIAYLLGPVAVVQPPWVAFGLTVTAVVLLRARDRLHGLAERIPSQEIFTLAQFLVLTGVVLPLLPNTAVTHLTPITPFQVWLAVIVVSSLSYGSYLLQRLFSAGKSVLLTSVLGGLYSSTATTVVLTRQLQQHPRRDAALQAGTILATSLMYLRLELVVLIFNRQLAVDLLMPLLILAATGATLAAICLWLGGRTSSSQDAQAPLSKNPLELTTAVIFAVLFVVISISSTWVKARYGHVGIYWLAGIVGVTDIDPFVLSVAQGGASQLDRGAMAIAILVAASSNNVLKAVYSIVFAGWSRGWGIALSLVALSLFGGGLACWIARGGALVVFR